MRICVCGGRDYSDADVVNAALDVVCTEGMILINGGATGADTLATDWARSRGVTHMEYPANWKKYGKAAGPIRNNMMIDSGIDLLVAFPGGRGTEDMVRKCKAKGIQVIRISADIAETD